MLYIHLRTFECEVKYETDLGIDYIAEEQTIHCIYSLYIYRNKFLMSVFPASLALFVSLSKKCGILFQYMKYFFHVFKVIKNYRTVNLFYLLRWKKRI